MDLKQIGARIKLTRKEKGMSQEKLSELVNVTPHYIYEIERGMKAMSVETLVGIALQLEVSTDYLLFGVCPNSSEDISALLDEMSEERKIRAVKAFEAILPYLK